MLTPNALLQAKLTGTRQNHKFCQMLVSQLSGNSSISASQFALTPNALLQAKLTGTRQNHKFCQMLVSQLSGNSFISASQFAFVHS